MPEGNLSYTVGHTRFVNLTEADNVFAIGGIENILHCKRILDNFIGTIKDDSISAKELTKKLDTIYKIKKIRLDELEKNKKDLGYLEEKDGEMERLKIEAETIFHVKCACWIVSLENGLFKEI